MTSIKKFIRYWRENIAIAREGYETILFCIGLISGGLSLLGKLGGFQSSIISDPIFERVSLLVAICSFLWCLTVIPFRRHEKLEVKLQKLEGQHQPLAMESVLCQRVFGNKYDCQIKIVNPSKTQPAQGVKVELVKMEPLPKMIQLRDQDVPIKFPVRLPPANGYSDIINADDHSIFNLFKIERSFAIEAEFSGDTGCKFNSFQYDLITVQILKSSGKNEELKKMAHEYRMTIAASATHCPRREETFKLTFSDEPNLPFALTKI